MTSQRTKLLLLDQTSFVSLAPKRGARSPYMDHQLIEENLQQLDEIFPAIAMGIARAAALGARAGAAVGRGAAAVGRGAAAVGRGAASVGRGAVKLGKQGVAKGKEIGGNVKQGVEKVQDLKDKFDKVKGQIDQLRRKGGEDGPPTQRKLPGDDRPGPTSTPPPAQVERPKADKGGVPGPPSSVTAPSLAVIGGTTATAKASPSPSPIPPPSAAIGEAPKAEKVQGGGPSVGPRAATLVGTGGQCPSPRTKTSVHGSPEGTKRCNVQTPGRAR